MGREISVRTVRTVRSVIFQWVSADGRADGTGSIVPICVRTVPTVRICVRSEAIEILGLRTMRTMRTVFSLLYLAEGNRTRPRMTFTDERDFNADPAQRCSRAPQLAGKRAGCWRPLFKLRLRFTD